MLWLLLACGSGEEKSVEIGFGDSLDEGWNKIIPGGDTTCSRGSQFAFAVRKGSTPNIVIDFVGGGACWDELTCGFADATFTDNVGWVDDIDGTTAAGEGIYNTDSAENPFADYHHVMIPYCTGDIHWGNQTQTYGSGTSEVTIHHKGGVNTQAVMDWVAENYGEPEKIFITGCSAGAYGSIMWAPHVAEMYPDADLRQFGDSGAGVVTDEWFADSFPSWNGEYAFPTHIPALDPNVVDVSQMSTTDLYSEIAAFYPEYSFSQFNAYYDRVQVQYYQIMGGGDGDEWNVNMRESIQTIADRAGNFSYFTAGGDRHCIIMSDDLYTTTANGVRVIDWMTGVFEGDNPENVECLNCETESAD